MVRPGIARLILSLVPKHRPRVQSLSEELIVPRELAVSFVRYNPRFMRVQQP
jgi:hypothetical protein